MSLDDMHAELKENTQQEFEMPTLVVKFRRAKLVFARIVSKQGQNDLAVGALTRIVEQLGSKIIVLRSDNEPNIVLLKNR